MTRSTQKPKRFRVKRPEGKHSDRPLRFRVVRQPGGLADQLAQSRKV
jgi:hypothetical protein